MSIRITNAMLMALIINLVYAKAIGLTQGIMAREVENDIWIATLFATLQGLLIMTITVWVIRRLPKKNLLEQASMLMGKWVGKLIGVFYVVFFTGAYAAIMITFVYHLMDYFLPNFPVYVFVAVAVFVTMYATFHGLEVTGRIAIVGVYTMIALNLLLLMGSLRDFHVTQLTPVLENGVWPTIFTSRHNDTDWAMATMMTGLVLPLVKDQTTWMKASVGGILYGGIFVLMWPLLEVGVLSARETGHYVVACMQMARSAEIGWFIHRYEMIMVAFFAISLLVQLMMCLFCACISLSQTFGMKDFRPTVLPMSVALGVFGYWVVLDHNRAMHLLADWWPPIADPIAIGVPLLIFLLGLLFRNGRGAI